MRYRIFLILMALVFLVSMVSAETNKVYILNLNYNNGKLTLNDKIVKYGYYPDRKIQPEEGYRAEIISVNDDILYFFNFEIPSKIYVDVTNSRTKELSGGIIKLDKTDFALIMPYFEDAKEIRFYDRNNNKVLSIDIQEKLSSKREIVLLWLTPVVLIFIFLIFYYKKRRKI